jgi:hypothetical protein
MVDNQHELPIFRKIINQNDTPDLKQLMYPGSHLRKPFWETHGSHMNVICKIVEERVRGRSEESPGIDVERRKPCDIFIVWQRKFKSPCRQHKGRMEVVSRFESQLHKVIFRLAFNTGPHHPSLFSSVGSGAGNIAKGHSGVEPGKVLGKVHGAEVLRAERPRRPSLLRR